MFQSYGKLIEERVKIVTKDSKFIEVNKIYDEIETRKKEDDEINASKQEEIVWVKIDKIIVEIIKMHNDKFVINYIFQNSNENKCLL